MYVNTNHKVIYSCLSAIVFIGRKEHIFVFINDRYPENEAVNHQYQLQTPYSRQMVTAQPNFRYR